ncbi:glycosyltransferase [Nocardioides sp. Kera G14]|uniref:glycosyltransferase n=1 Tax=Nocardioides sp. Kera G14 TaxID=2884264 RepID=UPI001D117AE5|nr:glycosyltransferase [Nocardioides sp. Kera G14]UDY24082.1 glycosyltransferase [Nocardioides sp. Kera G14]
MKIFAWSTALATDASFHYRINAPLTELAYQGHAEVGVGPVLQHDAQVDVLIGHRLAAPEYVDGWAGFGDRALLVLEHDDDYVNFRSDHPTFQHGMSWQDYTDWGRDSVIRSLQLADLITVSVPHLAEVYRQHTDAEIVVLHNTVDEVLLEVPQRERQPGEQLIVGWGGTGSHARDWQLCGRGVKYGLTKADAHMVMMGSDFRPVLGYRDSSFVQWTDVISDYYLAIHGWHVVIAPLTDEQWSRSKSPLKALEAAALGVPAVVGDATPYRDFIVHGETGFLCRTDDDWMKAIRALGNDEEMRRAMGLAARERARGFIASEWAPTWAETYRNALARKGLLAGTAR